MSGSRDDLEAKLEAIDKEIAEAVRRLPAHSVKPPQMIDLFRLEDERELIIEQLNKMSS